MKVSEYVSLLTEVIHIIIMIKEKVLKRHGLWYGFYGLNIDADKASSKLWEKNLEGATKHSENLKNFRYILGSYVVGFMLLHLLPH